MVRYKTVWNTKMVNMVFFKSTDSHFARDIVFRRGKSITKISIYSRKTKKFTFHKRSGPISVNMSYVAGLTPPGMVPNQQLQGVVEMV